MKIFVDADAFPGAVKDVLFRAVERRKIPLMMVANQHMRIPNSDLFSLKVVPNNPDEADDQIVEMVEAGDLVVTADIPLADRVLEKGGYAINPRGTMYTQANIKQRLATRDLLTELRDTGVIAGGGPRPFDARAVQAFANSLDRFLTKHCK